MYNPSQPVFTNLSDPNQFQHTADSNNPYIHIPQPLISEPHIHPFGANPFANFQSHPLNLTHHGFQDPTAAAPIRYDAVTQPATETSLLPTSSNSLWTYQPLITEATINVPQQTTVAQRLRCEVCNIDCGSQDVLEKHLRGKKHNRNLQAINIPRSALLALSTGTMNGQVVFDASTVTASPELEIKKWKVLKSGTTVDSVRMCKICNVVCNSQDVFIKHMAGKKHAIQASFAALGEVGPYLAAARAQLDGAFKKAPKKIKIVQSAWCEVCKINCNSNDVYVAHLSGKKHLSNLEQLKKLSNDSSAAASSSSSSTASAHPLIGPEENPAIDAAKQAKKATLEEMLAKKQKIMEAGTAAGAIRTCTICNVVCNSLTVFNFHLGGQKHKDMVKKLQES